MLYRPLLFYWAFTIALWVRMSVGFVTEEILPPLEAVRPLLELLTDGIFAVLGIATLRNKRDIIFFISFILLAFFSTIVVNRLSFPIFLNGFREFVGLTLAFPALRYLIARSPVDGFVDRFDRQLYLFLWVQAFCVTIQFLKYGATDAVGGSFGYGGSGTVSILIYVVSFYLLMRRRVPDSLYLTIWRNKWLIILLYPSFLNETKISLILLALYAVLIFPFSARHFLRLLIFSPVIAAGLWGIFNVYARVTNQTMDRLLSLDFYNAYIMGEDVDRLVDFALGLQDGEFDDAAILWTEDLPRIAKIGLAFSALNTTRGGLWLGAGVGHFKGGTSMGLSQFAKLYNWLLLGTRPMLFFMFIQLGFLGVIWLIGNLLTSLMLRRNSDERSLNIKLYLAALFAVLMFYNDSFRFTFFCVLVFYPILIYSTPSELLVETDDENVACEDEDADSHRLCC